LKLPIFKFIFEASNIQAYFFNQKSDHRRPVHMFPLIRNA
jgi:hypothetical protein